MRCKPFVSFLKFVAVGRVAIAPQAVSNTRVSDALSDVNTRYKNI